MNNKNNNGFLRNAFLYIIVIIAVVTGVQYFAGGSQSPSQQLSYTQLVKKIEDGKVKLISQTVVSLKLKVATKRPKRLILILVYHF